MPRSPIFKRFLIGLVLIGVLFGALPPLTRWIIRRSVYSTIQSFEKKTGLKVEVGEMDFPDYHTLKVCRLAVLKTDSQPGISEVTDTLMEIRGVEAQLNYIGWFHRQPLDELHVDSLRMNVHWDTGGLNYNPLERYFRTTGSGRTSGDSNAQISWLRFVRRKLVQWPEVTIKHLEIGMRNTYREWIPERRRYRLKEEMMRLNKGRLEYRKHQGLQLQGEIRGEISAAGDTTQFLLSGQIDPDVHRLTMNLLMNRSFRIPFIARWTGTEIGFRGIDLTIDEAEQDSLGEHLDLQAHVHDLMVVSEAVAASKIQGIGFSARLKTDLSPDSIRIYPQTCFQIGQIKIYLQGLIRNLRQQPDLSLQARLDSIAFDDFFSSVPPVFMSRLEGIRLQGWMRYTLGLKLNLAKPDSVAIIPEPFFSSDFRLIRLSDSIDMAKYRGTFEHRIVTEAGNDSIFMIGPENPYYTPLDSLPQPLIHAVLLSEDGSYFTNNGFNLLQIERSLAENVREKRFIRGASTLSMQMVKNLFLSREKTFSRKFQEMILTWLINRENLLDEQKNKERHKKRGLEIYFNIAEWGPDVYGIGRACEFYFRKKPTALTPRESAFLATILPNPKKYERYFLRGDLRKSKKNYMDFLLRRLEEQGILPQGEAMNASNVSLIFSGEAKPWIIQAAYQDSNFTDTDEEIRF